MLTARLGDIGFAVGRVTEIKRALATLLDGRERPVRERNALIQRTRGLARNIGFRQQRILRKQVESVLLRVQRLHIARLHFSGHGGTHGRVILAIDGSRNALLSLRRQRFLRLLWRLPLLVLLWPARPLEP